MSVEIKRKYELFFVILVISILSCAKPPAFNNGSNQSPNSGKYFDSFSLELKYNSQLNYTVTGSVNNSARTIIATIKQPMVMDLKKIRPTFKFTGSQVMIDTVVQKSTVTENDFTKPVTYKVVAEDGTIAEYKVIIYFFMTYPYKPEAYDLDVTGNIVAGEILRPEYTYRDRNGDREKSTVIEWQVETAPYSGAFTTLKTEVVSDPALLSGGEITKDQSSFTIPNNSGRMIKVKITPKSEFPPDTPDMTLADTIGYTVEKKIATCIKSGTLAGLIINEIQTAGTTTKDEFIVLYNNTNHAIDISGLIIYYYGAGWTEYCNFANDASFCKPDSYTVTKSIMPNGCFLIAREESDLANKRKADIVLKGIPALDIPQDKGAIKIQHGDGTVIDVFGYGELLAQSYEGPAGSGGGKSPNASESLKRNNHADSDFNVRDLVVRTVTTPTGSGQNIFGLEYKPVIANVAITEKQNQEGNKEYEVSYDYFDWHYNPEGAFNYKWYIMIEEPAGQFTSDFGQNPADFPSQTDTERAFTVTEFDHNQLPVGEAPYLKLEITPCSTVQDGDKVTYWFETIGGDPKPIAPVQPARLIVSRVLPAKNIVELYARRGGSLDRLYLAKINSKYIGTEGIPVNEDFTEVLISDLGNETDIIISGQYITVQSMKTGDAHWDVDMTDFFRPGIDGPYSLSGPEAYKGIVLEVLKLTSPDGEPEAYHSCDMVVFGLNNASDLCPSIKRHILGRNKSRWCSVDNTYAWHMSHEPSSGVLQTMDISFYDPDTGLGPLPSDADVIQYIDAANDFIPVTTPTSNYIMYRNRYGAHANPYNDDDDKTDLNFDFIGKTEYVFNGSRNIFGPGGTLGLTSSWTVLSQDQVICLNASGDLEARPIVLGGPIPGYADALPLVRVNIQPVSQTFTTMLPAQLPDKRLVFASALDGIGDGDEVRISSTGTPPSPLANNTNYFADKLDSTHIALATTHANAMAHITINLTTTGIGTHTLWGNYKISDFQSVVNSGSISTPDFPSDVLISRILDGDSKPVDTESRADFTVDDDGALTFTKH